MVESWIWIFRNHGRLQLVIFIDMVQLVQIAIFPLVVTLLQVGSCSRLSHQWRLLWCPLKRKCFVPDGVFLQIWPLRRWCIQFLFVGYFNTFLHWLLSLRSKRFRLASEQRNTEERDSRLWPREKWNERQKWKRREGEGKERNACRQTVRFWKPAFASKRNAWLAGLVEQHWHVSIKGLFHTERSWMVRETHCSVVVVYSRRQVLPSKARAFSLTTFET